MRFLFGFDTRVDRRSYLRWGLGLMALKYVLDATAAWLVTGVWWDPVRYLNPIWSMRMSQFHGAPTDLFLIVGLMTLPFFWIGVSMSVRRAADAGVSPLVGLLFAAPLVNWLLMLRLATAPSSSEDTWSVRRATADPALPIVRVAMTASGAAAVFGLAMACLAAWGGSAYAIGLFFATPLLMGAIVGYLMNRADRRGVAETLSVAALSSLVTAGGLVVFALEGVVCIAMAAPLALAGAALGALAGRAIAIHGHARLAHLVIAAVAVASMGAAEREVGRPELHEVLSTIEIAAPPETVWANVVGFADLPAPESWIFRTGIAYPIRARLDGTGVGAVRRCEFSTGAFVEPITAWEPGRRLAFDVASQPNPLQELSFYAALHPPHLDTMLRSRRGEFRLIRLENGHTRLEGRTWYELDAAPMLYWRVWSDAIIHRIHMRVLTHIARLSEPGAARRP